MQQRPLPDTIEDADTLVERMDAAETVRDWSFILQDYIQFGNKKLSDRIAIFNLGPATDCVNLGTDHCQVDPGECYALKAENRFPQTLGYRRKQEYLWDCMPAELFVKAFLEIVSRKRKPVDALRFNESGDIRHQGDVTRMEAIAEQLADNGIVAYTYTASDFLVFADAAALTINASNADVEGADQRYIAVPTEEDIPEDGYHCPHDRSDVPDIKCGECRACIHAGGTENIYITLH